VSLNFLHKVHKSTGLSRKQLLADEVASGGKGLMRRRGQG